MDMTIKVLEDDSTLLQVRNPEEEHIAPEATLVTMYAVQPAADAQDAAKTLFRAADEPGVEIIRSVFPVKPKRWNKSRNPTPPSYLGLSIMVRITHEFSIMSRNLFPWYLSKARQQFAQRRNMTFTVLEASGCRITLITGKQLEDAHLYIGTRIPEAITIFKDHKSMLSKAIEPFLRLDRVPSRHIQHFPVPDLPVTHVLGRQVGNRDRLVGFPQLQQGIVLVAGSNPQDRLAVLHQLTGSLVEQGPASPIFLLDTQSELNGLVQYFKQHPASLRGRQLQVLRLGTNIHLNLCDVIVPDQDMVDKEAQAALKAHLISQILTSAMQMSEYMMSRFEMPLQVHLKKAASSGSIFTLHEVSVDITGGDSEVVDKSGVDTFLTDMFAVEQLAGILEQFRAYPEINYAHFLNHFSQVIAPPNTVTIFQMSESHPPTIVRAIIAYLLHFLAQFLTKGVFLLTHAEEYLSRWSSEVRPKHMAPKLLVEACTKLARHNLLVLSSQTLYSLNQSLGLIEAVDNLIYLRLTNDWDRQFILSRHQLNMGRDSTSHRTQQQTLGISRGEGLLFREDASHTTGFHFTLENQYPVDLNPVSVGLVKRRGSETLGLTPLSYAIMMQILKNLKHFQSLKTDMLQIVTSMAGGQAEKLINQLRLLQLFQENVEEGRTFWVITTKGEDFHDEQHGFVDQLPQFDPPDQVQDTLNDLAQLESFYAATDRLQDRKDTNIHVKVAVGRLLSYTRLLRNSIPWERVAEYHDLEQIKGLEWQDFKTLFAKAYDLVDHLLLEVKNLNQASRKTGETEVLEHQAVTADTATRTLEAFLPTPQFVALQRLSKELGLPEYPQTGIFDIAFELHTQGRVLSEELASHTTRPGLDDG